MANTIPAVYPLPDPVDPQAGETIQQTFPAELLAAANYLSSLARFGFEGLWNVTDDICQRTAALPVMPAIGSRGAHVSIWPLAAYGVRTDLEVVAFGRRDGAAGTVRFRSVKTGNTVDLALPAANGYTAVGSLTVDCSAGDEWIEMYVAGDGVDPAHVFTASGDFPALAGALAAPSSASEPTPFDADELDADEPWSSDVSLALMDNLAIYLGWVCPVMTWSGTRNSTSAGASYTLPPWDHTMPIPLHSGQLRRLWPWTVRALATNVGGGDELVVYSLGTETGGERGAVTVSGPAGQKVRSTSAQPADIEADGSDVRLVRGLDYPVIFLGLFPADSTAELNSFAAWGVG